MSDLRRVLHGENLDRLAAVTFAVLAQIELWTGHAVPGPKALAVPVAIVVPACIALRRRWPFGAGCVALAANALLVLVAGPNMSVALTVAWMCALYGIAVWTDARGFRVGLVVLAAMNIIVGQFGPHLKITDGVFFTVIPGIAMFILRRAVRDRQLLAETLAARAELLEREHELRANEAVAEERARIARELHDLVAHNVSMMVVQAGAERHGLPEDQGSMRETLTSIEQAGRQALAEARRLLGMLRRNGDDDQLQPQPSIDQVESLVEQVERTGLPVELNVDGDRRPLPAGVDLCAYRIVQEALTNAVKHAGPAHAEVVLRYTPSGLDIEVRDDGRGLTPASGDRAGHGLIGMRERVALYGGKLQTGARESGGFEVRAHLPLA